MNNAFSPEAIAIFWQSISLMGKSMIGIFVFMLIFFFVIIGLRKLFPVAKNEE